MAASASQKVGAWKELDRKKKEEQERKEREMEARLKAQGSMIKELLFKKKKRSPSSSSHITHSL